MTTTRLQASILVVLVSSMAAAGCSKKTEVNNVSRDICALVDRVIQLDDVIRDFEKRCDQYLDYYTVFLLRTENDGSTRYEFLEESMEGCVNGTLRYVDPRQNDLKGIAVFIDPIESGYKFAVALERLNHCTGQWSGGCADVEWKEICVDFAGRATKRNGQWELKVVIRPF